MRGDGEEEGQVGQGVKRERRSARVSEGRGARRPREDSHSVHRGAIEEKRKGQVEGDEKEVVPARNGQRRGRVRQRGDINKRVAWLSPSYFRNSGDE
jgi:hypothetical protein